MQKSFVVALALAGALSAPSSVRAQFADAVVSYTSGTGYQPGYTTPASSLGEPSRFTPGLFGGPVDPFNTPYLSSQVVSIGSGGWLTVSFNTPILNNAANLYGFDFQIFGNAGFAITNGDYSGGGITDGSLFGADAISTRVSVSSDGLNFFTLNPLLAPTVDGLFPTDGNGDFGLPVNPSLSQSDFAGNNLTGIRALYAGSGGGAGFDISWAQDGGGQSVSLSSISYVRVDVLAGNAEIDGLVAVPEPATASLGLVGGLAFLVARRKMLRLNRRNASPLRRS